MSENFFGQKDYPELLGYGTHSIEEEGSLLIAQCNFIRKSNLGYDLDPIALNDNYCKRGIFKPGEDGAKDQLNWDSLKKFDPTITITSQGQGWPESNNAIVKFYFLSAKSATHVYHYCLVEDYEKHLIIDSYDGEIKPTGPYGDPIGYATYTAPELQVKTPAKSEYVYIWVLYDNIWEVARRLGLEATKLMEHNDITDPSAIEPGATLHLYAPRKMSDERHVTYELFDEPRHMHISHVPGTQRIAFNNARKWSDLEPDGRFFPYRTNLVMVALAHVPIGKDEMAAYYLDAWALGHFKETGNVAYTVGFNHTHLSNGRYVEITTTPEQVPELEPEEVAEINYVPEEPEFLILPEPEEVEVDWRTTYKAFERPERYVAQTPMIVQDLDGRRTGKPVYKNDEVVLTGVFLKDGEEYGRPPRSETSYHWYGVPMKKVIPYKELYNTHLDLIEKVATRQPLSTPEKAFEIFARNVSQVTRLRVKYDTYKQTKRRRS